MERIALLNPKKLADSLKKYKYPILILLLGAVLLLWPAGRAAESDPEPAAPELSAPALPLEEQLEAVLSCIDGAGRVRVLLTRRAGDETVYQLDTDETQTADGASTAKRATVMADGRPVVRQTVYGAYQGALIVCDGAQSASVRLELVKAVASLTGLPTDRITVIKMKS